jgi:phage-related protein (TIGR01555 family)
MVERYKPRRAATVGFFQHLRNRPRALRDATYVDPFTVQPTVQHPTGVAPEGSGLAMDDAFNASSAPQQWAANAYAAGLAISSSFFEGQAFPGYAYLSELAQRPEYRRIAEVIATEMTRKWIRIQSTANTDDETDDLEGEEDNNSLQGKQKDGKDKGAGAGQSDDKADKIKELNDELDRLKIRDAFCKVATYDGFMGRAHLYLDTGDTENRDELKMPIGNGRSAESLHKFKGKKKFLRAVRPVEAVWVYPTNYNSNDPLSDQWYSPESWFVMGKEIHRSRLLRFVGREVPDLLKPAYSFGGLSLSQMCKPYVDNWLRTRQSVADIISAFSIFVLHTNLSTLLEPTGGQDLNNRAAMFNDFRDNKGLMLVDKETEEFTNVSASLGSLDNLQAQTQEHICSISGIPVVKYMGIQPAGLNASSEGEIRVFYDWIHAYQERLFRAPLTIVLDFVMLSLWGEVDQDLTFKFEPLWSLDEKSLAEMREVDARTGASLITSGVIDPVEERARVAADPESPYASIDVADVPEPPEQGMPGQEPGQQPGQEGGEQGGEPPAEPKAPGGHGEDEDPLAAKLIPILRGAPDGVPEFIKGRLRRAQQGARSSQAADRFRRPFKG